jgi:hypothetical protein
LALILVASTAWCEAVEESEGAVRREKKVLEKDGRSVRFLWVSGRAEGQEAENFNL